MLNCKFEVLARKPFTTMKNIFLKIVILALLAFGWSCGGGNTTNKSTAEKPAETATTQTPRPQFPLQMPPEDMDREEQIAWLKVHFWDGFDFNDRDFIARADTAEMVNAYALYITLLMDNPRHAAPIDSLIKRATGSRAMLDYFAYLSRVVLNDPNSPLRNDEFYIPVLEAQLASPYYDEYERIAPEFDLKMARQNRLGQRANDIAYTTLGGRTHYMYNIRAEYTLLFISNPGCPMCRDIREGIQSSPMLNEMIEQGRLKVLIVHPDADLTEWRNHATEFPKEWIYAYDEGCMIEKSGSYNLNAIPALYLLDSDKKVLVKDSTDIPYIEEIIDRRG